MLTDLDRPAPYRVAQQTRWIVSDDPSCEGLAILVRTSITNAEQTALIAKHDDLTGDYAERWMALDPEQRDMADSPRARERALIAEYILDWNAVGLTEAGEEAPLPPPAEIGGAAFDLITVEETAWITQIVLLGYLATGKAGGWRRPSTATGATSEPAPAPAAAAA